MFGWEGGNKDSKLKIQSFEKQHTLNPPPTPSPLQPLVHLKHYSFSLSILNLPPLQVVRNRPPTPQMLVKTNTFETDPQKHSIKQPLSNSSPSKHSIKPLLFVVEFQQSLFLYCKTNDFQYLIL